MLVNCVAYQDGLKLGQIEPREIRDYTNRPGCFVWVAMLEPDATDKDIEAALAEEADARQAHEADGTDAHDASAISISDSGGYFTGTEVETALQELGAGGGGGVVFAVDAEVCAGAAARAVHPHHRVERGEDDVGRGQRQEQPVRPA